MAFSSIVDPVLRPFLFMHPLLSLTLLSFIIALIMNIIYKLMTNQTLMKTLKEDIKKFQKEMKELKHDPKKVMEVQKKAMETNMKYMMHSMKPTLVTFIPIILIFGWLQANLAFQPIMPDQEFNTTIYFSEGVSGEAELVVTEGLTIISNSTQKIENRKAEWVLKGVSGEYVLEYLFKDKKYSKDVLITTKQEYKPITEKVSDGTVESINIGNIPLKPLNLFGWKVGWLGTYIIFSIIFSMVLRKIMKLH